MPFRYRSVSGSPVTSSGASLQIEIQPHTVTHLDPVNEGLGRVASRQGECVPFDALKSKPGPLIEAQIADVGSGCGDLEARLTSLAGPLDRGSQAQPRARWTNSDAAA